MQATVIWNQKMGFSGETESGHHLAMDAAPENGGDNQAPRPTELLLHAVAGCTGIDIVSILEKMRLTLTSFEMDIEGERADDHPRRFTTISIHYRLEGDLPDDKVRRAIALSKDKYCSVSQSLNAEIEVYYSINGVRNEEPI
ncbi:MULTISPECIES: OsmC family protein [Exiguobacterium]|uniref:OsmC family protein n=1 Tax=Exiguobacterium sibiricum (strain DSM 17290 / CCUG 55495 / CIP 109462 / JCM 13490 / 255-15) TaxID=262543 RepID=B1YER7_EXIS2|nr:MULTISPECIES: OsmC family protein [Exiguobacterium]ACB60675.1 OsmC family protein [Exiguobacterium sibiricum 255-15]RDB34449.1 OsmC family peroxiredoxin [Exiguobacterium sp. RIT594]